MTRPELGPAISPDLSVVLLHGFGTSGQVWHRLAPLLGGGRTLCPDLPGFGEAAGRRGHTVSGMADHVQEVIGEAFLGPYILVGHSMGAKVAAELAARTPAGLAGLALVAPSPPGGEPMSDRGRAELKAAWNDAPGLRSLYTGIIRRPLADDDLAALVRDGQRASRAAWMAWPETGSREDLRARARAVQVPTLVLASHDDPAISFQTMEQEVAPLFARLTLETLRGVGHLSPLEAPQEVAHTLRTWAQGMAGAPG